MKKSVFAVLTYCFFVSQSSGQQPVRTDANSLLQYIVLLPPTVESVHSTFTRRTKFGEKFSDEPLALLYNKVKSLDSAIHDATIRRKMKAEPRPDMPDTIYFEDIRWKMAAMRPLLGADVRKKLLATNPATREKVSRVFEMQTLFDWVLYYKEDDKVKRAYEQKLAAIRSAGQEPDITASNVVEVQVAQFTARQQLWMDRYNRYSKAFLSLHQQLEDIQYGDKVSDEDRHVVLPVLADVQSRALQTIEKMIWNEMMLSLLGEMFYNDKRLLSVM